MKLAGQSLCCPFVSSPLIVALCRINLRYVILTAVNSLHGRTLAGISATGQDKIKKGFGPGIGDFLHVPFNDLEATAAAVTDDTVCIHIEGVQGESGIVPATPGGSVQEDSNIRLCSW